VFKSADLKNKFLFQSFAPFRASLVRERPQIALWWLEWFGNHCASRPVSMLLFLSSSTSWRYSRNWSPSCFPVSPISVLLFASVINTECKIYTSATSMNGGRKFSASTLSTFYKQSSHKANRYLRNNENCFLAVNFKFCLVLFCLFTKHLPCYLYIGRAKLARTPAIQKWIDGRIH